MRSDHHSSVGPHEHWLNKGDLLTVEEAADILRISPKTVREWLRKGKLVSLKFGKQWRIRRQDLESFALQAVRAAQLQNLQPLPDEDHGGRTDARDTTEAE